MFIRFFFVKQNERVIYINKTKIKYHLSTNVYTFAVSILKE